MSRKRNINFLLCTTSISSSADSCDFSNSRHGFNRLGRRKPSGEIPQRIFIVLVEPILEIQRITQRVVSELRRRVSSMMPVDSIPSAAENHHAPVLYIVFQIMGLPCFQPEQSGLVVWRQRRCWLSRWRVQNLAVAVVVAAEAAGEAEWVFELGFEWRWRDWDVIVIQFH